MDSSGLMSSFHLSARGKQLNISNKIAILMSTKLTFETLCKNVSKFSPTNAKYNPEQLRITARKSLTLLLN